MRPTRRTTSRHSKVYAIRPCWTLSCPRFFRAKYEIFFAFCGDDHDQRFTNAKKVIDEIKEIHANTGEGDITQVAEVKKLLKKVRKIIEGGSGEDEDDDEEDAVP